MRLIRLWCAYSAGESSDTSARRPKRQRRRRQVELPGEVEREQHLRDPKRRRQISRLQQGSSASLEDVEEPQTESFSIPVSLQFASEASPVSFLPTQSHCVIPLSSKIQAGVLQKHPSAGLHSCCRLVLRWYPPGPSEQLCYLTLWLLRRMSTRPKLRTMPGRMHARLNLMARQGGSKLWVYQAHLRCPSGDLRRMDPHCLPAAPLQAHWPAPDSRPEQRPPGRSRRPYWLKAPQQAPPAVRNQCQPRSKRLRRNLLHRVMTWRKQLSAPLLRL